MSIQNVVSFGSAVSSDEAMQAELKAAVGGAKGQEAFAKTAEFAGTKGYDFTADEAEQGYQALQKSENSDELNEAELEVVSGGKSGKQAGQQVQQTVGNAVNQGAQAVNYGLGQVSGFFKGLFG